MKVRNFNQTPKVLKLSHACIPWLCSFQTSLQIIVGVSLVQMQVKIGQMVSSLRPLTEVFIQLYGLEKYMNAICSLFLRRGFSIRYVMLVIVIIITMMSLNNVKFCVQINKHCVTICVPLTPARKYYRNRSYFRIMGEQLRAPLKPLNTIVL